MLEPFHDTIQEIAFIYAHRGVKADKNDNRIYAVAAAIIDTETSKKEFNSLVRYTMLTARENYLSNISKDMLVKSPTPKQAGNKLRRFLKGRKFVFAFDHHNNPDELREFCGDVRIADLDFAAEFFLPHLESHAPGRLWKYLFGKERDKISFSPGEMLDLSVEFVKHICGELLNDEMNPRAAALRFYLKKSDTLFGEVFLHITKNCKAYFGGLFDSYTGGDTPNWNQFLEKAEKISRKKNKKVSRKKVSSEHLESLYRGIAEADRDYVFRSEQLDYAGGIADALNLGSVLTIEAGTGTGKTQGYLIPVMEFLYRNKNARAVVSTYTKSLQQQIFQREIAFTKNIFRLYEDIPVAILKGKSSYICVEKLNQVYEDGMGGRKLLAWLYFVNLTFYFRDTEADTAGEKIRFYLDRDFHFRQILSDISAREGCTPKHKCCPAQVITAEASAARLVITNHHKLALLDNDTILSGLFRNYIIDEANHFENAVREALGAEVRSWEITDVMGKLKPSVRKIWEKTAGDLEKGIAKALGDMDTVRQLLREFRRSLIAMNPKASVAQECELQYDHPGFTSGRVGEQMTELRKLLHDIGEKLKFVKDEDLCRMLKIQARTLQTLRMALVKLDDYSATLMSIEESLKLAEKVTSYRCFRKSWILTAQSVEVGDIIRRHIYEQKDCIIYTAATLCHRGSFDSFRSITGMGEPLLNEEGERVKDFHFKLIPSPFSKDAMKIVVPRNAASGKFENKGAWIKSVVEILPELIKENRGSTLVLFSSYSDLEVIAEGVSEFLTTYPLLIQQKGTATATLCEEFRSVRESVLFGVNTFWYGVDFRGDTLTQVIITRIPYPSFTDPVQMARKKILSPKDFWKRYYYDAEIKMKQGMGRLIRSDTDRGRVVILDSRYRL